MAYALQISFTSQMTKGLEFVLISFETIISCFLVITRLYTILLQREFSHDLQIDRLFMKFFPLQILHKYLSILTCLVSPEDTLSAT